MSSFLRHKVFDKINAVKKSAKHSFLYRYRFIIGYIALMVAFFGLLSFLPSIAPGGLAPAEMESVVAANKSMPNFIRSGKLSIYHII